MGWTTTSKQSTVSAVHEAPTTVAAILVLHRAGVLKGNAEVLLPNVMYTSDKKVQKCDFL